jgi:cytoskeletal protein RodZ
MADFSAQLKQTREQRGISLRQISTTTKISVGALEALERGDFSRLPGGIFSRAFVRAYATEVGLDPDQTVDQFLHEYELYANSVQESAVPEVTADDRAFLERQRRAARWLRGILIAFVLLVAGGIIAWQVRARGASRVAAEEQVPPPTPSAAVTLPPAPPPAAPDTPSASRMPASAPGAGVASPSPAPVQVPATVAQQRAADTTPAAPAPDQIVIRLETSADCWVRASTDGKVQFQATLHAGDSRDLNPAREILLQVGNTGAFKWTINGRTAKSLGPAGQTASIRINRDTLSKYVE